jgi:hypothetical protein
MTLTDESRRGDEAKQVLSSAVYKEAWASYEMILMGILANADTTKERAEEVRGWLIAARKARGHLERIVKEGVLAEAQIKQEETRKRNWAARYFREA